jgi:hypothetical protein
MAPDWFTLQASSFHHVQKVWRECMNKLNSRAFHFASTSQTMSCLCSTKRLSNSSFHTLISFLLPKKKLILGIKFKVKIKMQR